MRIEMLTGIQPTVHAGVRGSSRYSGRDKRILNDTPERFSWKDGLQGCRDAFIAVLLLDVKWDLACCDETWTRRLETPNAGGERSTVLTHASPV